MSSKKNDNIVELLEKTIHGDLLLNRNDEQWILNGCTTVTLRSPTRRSIGFSLDNSQYRPLNFFGTSPPKDLAKMCDGILVLLHRDNLYWFVVEQKTSNQGDYKKQLINGKCFCDWLIALYRVHGYLFGNPVVIGLLVWKGREKNVSKGLTSHCDNPMAITETQVELFEHSFNVRRPDVPLLEIIKRVEKKRQRQIDSSLGTVSYYA